MVKEPVSFNQLQTVVFVSKGKIKAAPVTLGAKPKIGDVAEYDWKPEDLEEILASIKRNYGVKSIRVLLDDDLGQIFDLNVPLKTDNERKYVAEKVKEQIASTFKSHEWDYKEIGKTEKEKKVRVFTPGKEFLEALTVASKKVSLEIETIEPVGLAKDRHEDPMVGLAIKEGIIKEEEETSFSSVSPEPEAKDIRLETEVVESSLKPASKFPIKTLVFLGIVVLTAFLVVMGGLLVSRNAINKGSSAPTPIPTIVSSPSIEPTPTVVIGRKDLTIKVLNGSGIPGLAGKAKTYLEGLGYKGVQTGNASSFSYATTSVEIKEGKRSFLPQLLEDLGKEYKVSTDSMKTLSDSATTDAVVILGKE